jgi:cell wall-associated NlpC family hydrolase
MSRTSKKIAAAVVTVGIAATTVFANINADNIYDDSNIGISSALDRYVESVQNENDLLSKSVTATDTTDNSEAADKASDTEKDNDETDSKEVATEADTEETTEEATCKYPQFQDRCLTTVESEVNIRAEADENSELVGTLAANGIALVKEKGDQWTKIASGTCEGYIKNDYLVFGDEAGEYAESHCSKLATITTETLNVRAEADENSDCITMVPGGESYVVMDETDGWVEIEIDDGTSGYISADYADITFNVVRAVSVEEAEAARKAAEEAAAAEAARKAAEEAVSQESNSSYNDSSSNQSSSSNSGSSDSGSSSNSSSDSSSSGSDSSTEVKQVASSGSTGTELANYALQFVGNPYVYGGTSLTNGADCSGFTLSVYANYGISLPHSASAQANYGTEVSLSQLEAGDLLFYADPDGSIGHVAIYTGGGMVVHASTEATGIKTSVYNYRTPVKAVRLLGQ